MDNNENIKPFLGIMFECCNVYGRIYKNKEETHYEGKCPRCLRTIKIKIQEKRPMRGDFYFITTAVHFVVSKDCNSAGNVDASKTFQRWVRPNGLILPRTFKTRKI